MGIIDSQRQQAAMNFQQQLYQQMMAQQQAVYQGMGLGGSYRGQPVRPPRKRVESRTLTSAEVARRNIKSAVDAVKDAQKCLPISELE